MEIRHLGISSLRVSLVGLGCNNFGVRIDLETARKVLHKALDLGITMIDTADIYGKGGSETFLGEIMGHRRNDLVLATKFGMPMDETRGLVGASRRYIMTAVEASLKRLRTDHIDLYQLHQPDPQTPIEETLRALDDLIKQGKIRHIGCSNLPSVQVEDAQSTAEARGLNAFILPGRIQPGEARHRARALADHAKPGPGPIAVLPARRWPVDRQVQARTGTGTRDPVRKYAEIICISRQ